MRRLSSIGVFGPFGERGRRVSEFDKAMMRLVLASLVLGVGLAILMAAGFGLALLGDEFGLWRFDSGLGSEAGDG